MFFSEYSRKQILLFATTCWLWIVTSVACAALDTQYTLSIDSAANQPFIAELNLGNVSTNTELGCFSAQWSIENAAMHLEYTTLGNTQGLLTIWSDTTATGPFTLRVNDQCQHSHYIFHVDAMNQVSAELPTATPAAENLLTSQAPIKTIPADTAGTTLSDQEFESLQQQIRQLQENFELLQTQLNTLYRANLQQSHALEMRSAELSHAKSENHLLRTLILCLGLALLCSSYFFADWLRRHSENPRIGHGKNSPAPKTAGHENPGMREQAPTTAPTAYGAYSASPAATGSPTPPSNIRKLPTGRAQPFPRQANDDELSPRKQNDSATATDSETVIKDASHFLTHGRINQAIQYLQNHLAQQPKCSPWVWLYLLDLLGREGKQQEFDLAASECRKHFNINVERNPDPALHGIESFSRITRALQQAWGTPEVVTLIDDLIYNTRLVPRIGFERTVFEDLMLLRAIACASQALPKNAPSYVENVPKDDSHGLRELQQLSEDIGALSPSDSTAFQYWSDFTFELDEYPAKRKSA